MAAPTVELLAQHRVLVPSDNEWQREARLRQAVWRERQGLPVGLHRDRPLGSRIAMPFAEQSLANFMTETIRSVVRTEVLDSRKSAGKVYRRPRIFDDLLSSQPLCFNLFGELQRDPGLASRVFAGLLGRPALVVTAIEFEYSPGRGDPRFTSDGSAFDIFVTYTSANESGFVGIEVKYAENLEVEPARHRARYDEVAETMGCFLPDALALLREKPLEQFWRDHLLAGSLLLDKASGFGMGTFAVIYPERNVIVADAVSDYRSCLADAQSFNAWTLEAVLDAIDAVGAGFWAREVRARYIGAAADLIASVPG